MGILYPIPNVPVGGHYRPFCTHCTHVVVVLISVVTLLSLFHATGVLSIPFSARHLLSSSKLVHVCTPSRINLHNMYSVHV